MSKTVSWIATKTFIHPVDGRRVHCGEKGEDALEDSRHIKNLLKIAKNMQTIIRVGESKFTNCNTKQRN